LNEARWSKYGLSRWRLFGLGLLAVPLNFVVMWLWLFMRAMGDAHSDHPARYDIRIIFWTALAIVLAVAVAAWFAAHKRRLGWVAGLSALQWLPPLLVLLVSLFGPR
jgi:MFS superfamily sulfate permease-like transporter